jgi:glycosyltransferase involved in cell wall biosynthesis
MVYTLTRRERLVAPLTSPRVEGLEIRHFVYRRLLEIPIAFFEMLRELNRVIAQQPFKAVILSGVFAYLSWPLLRRKSKIIIADIHGPLEEWLEYPPKFIKWKFLLPILFNLMKIIENIVVRKCNAALVVSHPLELYVKKEYACKRIFVIPCGGVSCPSPEEYLFARNSWRERLGIGNSTVFVYSGGLSKWQLIDKMFLLFGNLKEYFPDAKLLLITPEPKNIKNLAILSGVRSEDIISISLSAHEVGFALCACDIGFLLRENNITNRMAFPNKFTEYIRSGLLIITSPGLVEPYEIVIHNKIGIGISPANSLYLSEEVINLRQIIEKRKDNIISYYLRCLEIFEKYLNMRKQILPLVNFIKYYNDYNNN